MDKITPERRSANMSRIRSKDTKPEMAVRKVAHGLGYRFRLHQKDLPGKPDLVFPSRKAVVFVHGCFWHGHSDPGCRNAVLPKSRRDFWLPKLSKNKARDSANVEALEAAGWRVMVVWECEIKDDEIVAGRLRDFLGPPGTAAKAGNHADFP
jgi:DNA mismatch endonuclease (patch repair protein)